MKENIKKACLALGVLLLCIGVILIIALMSLNKQISNWILLILFLGSGLIVISGIIKNSKCNLLKMVVIVGIIIAIICIMLIFNLVA